MIYLEVSAGMYVELPEDVARAGQAAIDAFVETATPIVAGPDAPSAIVEAERAKLFHVAEVEAENRLAEGAQGEEE